MRLITSLLLLLALAVPGFSTAATTTTIDLRATTGLKNTVPASFSTTATQDHVAITIGAQAHTLMFLDTQDWEYIDPTSTKKIKILSGQTITLEFGGTQTFDVDRVSADGVCTVLVIK